MVEMSDTRIAYTSRTIVAALESMSDTMEQIAVYVQPRHVSVARPYVRLLEGAGFKTRLFTDRAKAMGWLGQG